MATWIEYRDKDHQEELGTEVSGSIRAADGRRHWTRLDGVKANDIIVHLAEDIDRTKYFVGYSIATEDVHQDGASNVVLLKNFNRFNVRISYTSFANRHKRTILRDIAPDRRPHYLPFQEINGGGFRIPEGYYFGAAPRVLERLVNDQYGSHKSGSENKREQKKAKGVGPGPSGGGIKKTIVWEARSYYLVKDLEKYLKTFGWKEATSVWWTDVLMEKIGGRVLIEVKPEATTHNLITAIGQIICYRSPFDDENNTFCIIASKGKPADELADVMKKH